MQVEIGQVWEDADKRRAGRTFKVVNISDGVVTCENLTGPEGSEPAKLISFIKVNRFLPRYYRLKRKTIKTFSMSETIDTRLMTSSEAEIYSMVHRMPTTIVRHQVVDEEANLLDKANKHWNVGWRKMGSFIVTDNDMFDISVRSEGRAQDLFDVQIKLYNYRVYSNKVRGNIETALDEAKRFLYNTKRNIAELLEAN